MSINAGLPSPATLPREPRRVCCVKCRRGMPGMLGPCGLALNCECHRRAA